jgi:hypothetical protein
VSSQAVSAGKELWVRSVAEDVTFLAMSKWKPKN